MSLSVVEFANDEGLLIIHSKWLLGTEQCYCPPYWSNGSKLKKAILAAEIPNMDSWKLYDMRILRQAGKCIV